MQKDLKNGFIARFIYWFLYPTRNSYKRKLRALLEGLETQNVDKLMKEGKTGDFRNYGKSYINAVRDKVESAKTSPILMEYTKADLNWLMSKMECTSERYMEAEKMIIEIIDMPWWKRLFCGRKLLRFLKSRGKYNF